MDEKPAAKLVHARGGSSTLARRVWARCRGVSVHPGVSRREAAAAAGFHLECFFEWEILRQSRWILELGGEVKSKKLEKPRHADSQRGHHFVSYLLAYFWESATVQHVR